MGKNDIAPQRAIDRLRNHVLIDERGCWVFQGGLANGYGRATWSTNGKMTYALAHRVMYTHEVGQIPEGLDLDHLCRNRACCNPAHLEPVSRQTNLLRGDTIPARRSATTECPKGHPYDSENTISDSKGRRNCRECVYERNRAYYWRNKERRAAYNKAWRERQKSDNQPQNQDG